MTVSCQWQFLVTQADDYESLVTQVDSVMQALLTPTHAAGGATADWPADVSGPAHFESLDFVAVPV